MKTYLTIVILFSFFVLYGFTDSPEKEQLVIKGFSLGMNKAEVKKVYEQFEKDKVAEYISIENEKYRDLIVRVAGYSAYFVDLSKGVQDDVVKRMEVSI